MEAILARVRRLEERIEYLFRRVRDLEIYAKRLEDKLRELASK